MTSPTFANIFSLYYTLYRAEATVPATTDDEYTIAMRFANEAVARWSNYDGTYWKELFTTLVLEEEGTTLETGVTEYDCPTNFREAGGFIRARGDDGNTAFTWPIIQPHEAQFRTDSSRYAYFTYGTGGTATLHINSAPTSEMNGLTLDYVYYKKPTQFTSASSTTELLNTEFIVHRMLAMRFRASRNPFYQDALRDSEDALKTMKMDNDSGSWADPWKLADTSGTTWGGDWTPRSIF